MFYLACTRFNNKTYSENISYRQKCGEPVIYGSTLKIRDCYPIGCLIFIVEMNNDKNKIEGIGLIKNLLVCDKRHKIYDNNEYNRYIYKGKYWISRDDINNFSSNIIEILDSVLFKGKSHLKCRIGVTIITERLFVHWNCNLAPLKNKIKELFITTFKNTFNNELDYNDELKDNNKLKANNNSEDKDKLIDEIYSDNNNTIYIEIIPKSKKGKRNRKEKTN